MKTLIVVLIALTAGFSKEVAAKDLTCVFTEPFYTVKVSERTKKVRMTENIEKVTKHFPILSIDRKGKETHVTFGPGIEENWSLRYTQDGKGSDGMSDQIYPFSALLSLGDTEVQHGGCYF